MGGRDGAVSAEPIGRPQGRHSTHRLTMAGIEAVLLLALQAILSGILVGGVYGILSVGLSLAFGVMRIVNFAHGELVMYGMYAGVIASRNFGIDPLLILPLSFLLLALVGAAQYQIVFRHFVGHATLQQLLAAIGCALVLQMIAQIIFGADTRTATSTFTGQYVVFGPFFLSQAQIVAFALASGLAGIAGTVLVTYFPTSPSVGFSLMPIIIIATTIGGSAASAGP